MVARTAAARQNDRSRARGSLRRDEVFWAYVFLSPWIIGLVVFILGPILFSLGMSFFNYTLGRERRRFIGLDNWIRAFTQDELFWPSIGRTFLYTAIVVPLQRLRRAADGDAAQPAAARRQRSTARCSSCRIWRRSWRRSFIWLWLLNPQYGAVNEVIFQIGVAPHGHRLQRAGLVLRLPSWALPRSDADRRCGAPSAAT